MNNFDLELKSIQLQNEKLLREMEVLHQLLEAVQPQSETQKEYYTVEDCAELKSGAALNTYKTNRSYCLAVVIHVIRLILLADFVFHEKK